MHTVLHQVIQHTYQEFILTSSTNIFTQPKVIKSNSIGAEEMKQVNSHRNNNGKGRIHQIHSQLNIKMLDINDINSKLHEKVHYFKGLHHPNITIHKNKH